MKKICLFLLLLTLSMGIYVSVDKSVTVREVIKNTTCDYIVKDELTWAILDPNKYLNKKVREITVCEDTENTICIFIYLDEHEEKIITKEVDK